MKPDMILNELSLTAPGIDEDTAKVWVNSLVLTAVAGIKLGVGSVIRAHEDIRLLEVVKGYNFAKWLNDGTVDKELQRRFKALTTKAPYLQDVEGEDIQNRVGMSEFFFNGAPADGLGKAFLLDALAVSFPSSGDWETSRVTLEDRYLDGDGEIYSKQVTVVHASTPEHVRDCRDWLEDWHRTRVDHASDVWARRKDMFPNLHFCGAVEKQLANLEGEHQVINSAILRLFELDRYASAWTTGAFKYQDLPRRATPESPVTLKDADCKKERTFECPDGQERTFSWHVRLTPLARRIHFYPDEVNHRIIIGYIGRHLKTVSYRT